MELYIEYKNKSTYTNLEFDDLINLVYDYLTEKQDSVYLDEIKFKIKIKDVRKENNKKIETTYTKLKKDLKKLKLIDPEFEITATYKRKKIEVYFKPDAGEFRKLNGENIFLESLAVIKNKKISLEKILKIKMSKELAKEAIKKLPKNKKKYLITTRGCIDKIKTE